MKEIKESEFNSIIANPNVTLVDFYASWCGPCGIQGKILEKLESSRAINCDIVKVNVDEALSLAERYSIDSIPTLMIFKSSELKKRFVGVTDPNELINSINELEN